VSGDLILIKLKFKKSTNHFLWHLPFYLNIYADILVIPSACYVMYTLSELH